MVTLTVTMTDTEVFPDGGYVGSDGGYVASGTQAFSRSKGTLAFDTMDSGLSQANLCWLKRELAWPAHLGLLFLLNSGSFWQMSQTLGLHI